MDEPNPGLIMDREGSESLVVTLVYSEAPPSHLSVSVLRASGLRAKTFRGRSNPYAVLRLGPKGASTPVICDTLSPRWNCELTFPLPPGPQGRAAAALTLTIYHRRSLLALPDKFLGSLRLRLEDIYRQEGKKEWFILSSEPRKKPKKRGQVELSFRFYREPSPLSPLPPNPQPLTQSHSQPCTQPPIRSSPLSQPSSRTPHSQSHCSPTRSQPPSICPKSHLSWDRDTPCSSTYVQPVVRRWEPVQPSCGEENSGWLDCVPPSAPAGPGEPAASPDCVSTTTSGDNGDLEDGQEARQCLLKHGEGPSSASYPMEKPSTAENPTDSHTSCNVPFQHSQQGRLHMDPFRFSFRSKLRRLRYRLDSGERGTLRLPACSAAMFRSSLPPYDKFPKIEVSVKPRGFFAQHFPCLGRREYQ
ncbi:uncharacterized protein LOC105026185 isoform X2 [Esox lucius]|uniref:uncharacterized protein LOC105026185 isoform X2 n=1 Tax=Esox lucius TaxID=8010 RepID=UPI001476E04D|nr:uncharacterized protein LOC105026185 isoform X2 [Esox lucius]XP_019901310.2 uncharacterized protein LOC105026185 isoform X2 [Esox lucius]